jgi:hypothetical protein
MAIDHTYYTQKRDKGLYLSIAFLLMVVVTTVGMYFYNVMLDNQNTELSNSIIHYDASISDIKKDKRLQVYELLKMNEKTISALAYAKIVNFISGFRKLDDRKFDLLFINSVVGHDSISFNTRFKVK